MSSRDLSIEDMEGLLHSHAQRLAERKFAAEPWHPCTPKEDIALTLGTFLLGISPVLIVIFFAVTK